MYLYAVPTILTEQKIRRSISGCNKTYSNNKKSYPILKVTNHNTKTIWSTFHLRHFYKCVNERKNEFDLSLNILYTTTDRFVWIKLSNDTVMC